jgi:hypothetical protein
MLYISYFFFKSLWGVQMLDFSSPTACTHSEEVRCILFRANQTERYHVLHLFLELVNPLLNHLIAPPVTREEYTHEGVSVLGILGILELSMQVNSLIILWGYIPEKSPRISKTRKTGYALNEH